MAYRTFKISRWIGGVAALLILAVTFGSLGAVIYRAEAGARFGPADWAALRFTLWQAFLSALISVVLAVPVARALARRNFNGRSALITLLGAPFILPVIVAVFGLLSVFGRNGIVATALGWLGLPPIQIFGLQGVVLAHVFFNLPLATRLILQGWLSMPAERFRLAASLGANTSDIARLLEYPMLRTTLPGAFMVIFLICITSFAVALTLGGGPKATTLELAIYQAFRFDFDLARAAFLAAVQFTVAGLAVLVAFRLTKPAFTGSGLDRVPQRWDTNGRAAKIQDIALLTLVTLFLATPLLMILINGLPTAFTLPTSVYWAAARSVSVALASAALTISLALPMALLISGWARGGQVVEGIAYLSIAASPLVIGTGFFILLFPFVDPVSLALVITAIVNSVMSLPFALRALVPEVARVEASFGPLADSLRLTGFQRLRLLLIPRLRRPLGFSAGLAAALSMGDLGVIALFADPQAATLPLSLYRLMAAYRMDEAAGAALCLLALSLTLFWIFDKGGRVDADR